MDILIAIIIFILGLVFGSFLNVVILRIDDLRSILSTRSHCPHCKANLKWYDLVPFISFFLLYGRCRYCREKVSWQYPLVEAATGIILLILYLFFGLNIEFFLISLIALAMIVIFVIDLRSMIIPDLISWPAIIVGLVWAIYHLVPFNLISLEKLLLGLAIGFGLIFLLAAFSQGRWMGWGDVKLGAVIGLTVWFPATVTAIFSAFLIGSVFALVLMALKQKKIKDKIPFGPFLVIGWMIGLLWGREIFRWYWGIIY